MNLLETAVGPQSVDAKARKKQIRRMVFLLVLLVLTFYFGFIAMSVLRA